MKKIGFTLIILLIFSGSVIAQSPSTTLRPIGLYFGLDYFYHWGEEVYDVIDSENIFYSGYDFSDMFYIYLGYNRQTINNLNLYGEFILGYIIGENTILRGRIGTSYSISTDIGNLILGFEPLLIINPFDIVTLNFIIGLDAEYYGGAIKIVNRIESPDPIESLNLSVFFHSRTETFGLGLAITIPISDNISDVGLTITPELNMVQKMNSGILKFYVQFPVRKLNSMGDNYWPTGTSFGLQYSVGS